MKTPFQGAYLNPKLEWQEFLKDGIFSYLLFLQSWAENDSLGVPYQK